jgi:hypothetical protein
MEFILVWLTNVSSSNGAGGGEGNVEKHAETGWGNLTQHLVVEILVCIDLRLVSSTSYEQLLHAKIQKAQKRD